MATTIEVKGRPDIGPITLTAESSAIQILPREIGDGSIVHEIKNELDVATSIQRIYPKPETGIRLRTKPHIFQNDIVEFSDVVIPGVEGIVDITITDRTGTEPSS